MKKKPRVSSKYFYTKLFLLFFLLNGFSTFGQAWEVTELSSMPFKTSNNAVCEGLIDGDAFVFSFGGIDSTRIFSGIHKRSFKYDVAGDSWVEIDALPDPRSKVASSANRIGNIIYIVGGYYVEANGSEISSKRVHRYDIEENLFLEDGADIPLAIDDQVQAVWRDSLLYVVTGWSNSSNVVNVQVYDPSLDQWRQATALPNISLYKVFGASGTIVEDTIYYFGGARIGGSFPANYGLIKGVINPDNPLEIDWSDISPDLTSLAYRSACTRVGKDVHWIGGSETTYNYNGIAYNGSGAVSPSGNYLVSNNDDRSVWYKNNNDLLPMDLRGIANISDTVKILAGGMITGPAVSNKVFKLELKYDPTLKLQDHIVNKAQIKMFPNPTGAKLSLESNLNLEGIKYSIFKIDGSLVQSDIITANAIDVAGLTSGSYLLLINGVDGQRYLRFEKE